MIQTPIYRGILQSDLDLNGFSVGPGGGGGLPPGWVSVKDAPYNAAGDGVTDDTAAIQQAINDTWNAGGGTVYLPPGKYLCNGTLDSNSHSILRIPFITYTAAGGTNTPSVELRGAFPVSWWLSGLDNPTYQDTRIVTTRTDGVTANGDALFACGPFISGDFPADYFTNMNFSRLTIRNIRFVLPANPTFYGLRLDCMAMAHVEDCQVSTTDVTVQPTHGTVGIRMPCSLNYAINFLYRTMVCGFGTGVKTGEHFRSNCCYVSRNMTGLEFTGALQASFVDGIAIDASPCFIRFTGYHQVVVKASFERIGAANAYGWMQTPTGGDVIDSGYMGTGQILYKINDDNTGRAADDISVTGAGSLQFIDLYQPSTRPLAARYMITGPLTGTVGVPSANFTVSLPVGTIAGGGGVTITPGDSGGGGSFTPPAVLLNAGSATFTYTGVSTGLKQIVCVNNGGLINPLQYGITLS